MAGLSSTCEKTRQKLAAREEQVGAVGKELTVAQVLRSLKSSQRRQNFERRWHERKARAMAA